MRNGGIAGRKWMTRQLRSRKTTSIANRMATVWMACEGIMSRPVPGSSPGLPNKPTSRRRLVPATLICSPSTVFLVVFRTAMISVSIRILLLRSHTPARSHTFPPGDYDRQQNHSDHCCGNANQSYVIHNPPCLLLSAKILERLHHGKHSRPQQHHKKRGENEDGQGKDQLYGSLSCLFLSQHQALDPQAVGKGSESACNRRSQPLGLHQHGDKLAHRIEINPVRHAPPGIEARFAGPLLAADNDQFFT